MSIDTTPLTEGVSRHRVLLVEDNDMASRGLARLLEACGFDVTVKNDGTSALRGLDLDPAPDFVLTDWLLPRSTALESGDETAFRTALGSLLTAVREVGAPLPDDSLEPSELILPDDGASLDQVRELLRTEGDGLIPGLPE